MYHSKHSDWLAAGTGYENSRSAEIIRHSIRRLKKKRVPVYLTSRNYQSAFTFLGDFNNEYMTIDKPLDWPENVNLARIVFRDEGKLINHFNVRVVKSNDDTITAAMPLEIYRLQRRQHLRVVAPYGSQVSYTYRSERFHSIPLHNFSANGMLFHTHNNIDLELPLLTDIELTFPVDSTQEDSQANLATFSIGQGEVVRSIIDDETNLNCIGVTFHARGKEEDDLVKLVRQREIVLLGKGVFS